MPRYGLKRLFLLILLPISLVFVILAPRFSVQIEQNYSLNIYNILSSAMASIFGLFPFSVAEILLTCAVLLFIWYTVYTIVKFKTDISRRWYKLYTYCVNISVIAVCLFSFFVFACGLNYYRQPLTETSGLKVRKSNVYELRALCMDLAVTANKSSLSLAADENGVTFFGDDCYGVLADKAPVVMKSASCTYPQLKGIYSKPKGVIGSELMSQCNILGIYSPFTFEANINTRVPQYGIPASMCHELSHLRGFMREDEANYLAYYACVNCGDDRFVYSGAMLGLTYSMSRLAAVNTELYNEVYASLNEHVRADLNYSARYWSKKNGAASKVSNTVNDVYLKVNNQTDGVQSYGRMVDLMLAEFRHRKNLDITTVN